MFVSVCRYCYCGSKKLDSNHRETFYSDLGTNTNMTEDRGQTDRLAAADNQLYRGTEMCVSVCGMSAGLTSSG